MKNSVQSLKAPGIARRYEKITNVRRGTNENLQQLRPSPRSPLVLHQRPAYLRRGWSASHWMDRAGIRCGVRVSVVVEAMSFEAQDLIGQAIKKHKGRICVNWSGGRDSTVVLHMALKEDPQIPVIFANTLCEHGATWAYIRKLWKEWDLNLHMSYPIKPIGSASKSTDCRKCAKGKTRPRNAACT